MSSRRWFQLSLKSLFLLVLLVATFLAGYTLATKQAEGEQREAELKAQRDAEATSLKRDELLSRYPWIRGQQGDVGVKTLQHFVNGN